MWTRKRREHGNRHRRPPFGFDLFQDACRTGGEGGTSDLGSGRLIVTWIAVFGPANWQRRPLHLLPRLHPIPVAALRYRDSAFRQALASPFPEIPYWAATLIIGSDQMRFVELLPRESVISHSPRLPCLVSDIPASLSHRWARRHTGKDRNVQNRRTDEAQAGRGFGRVHAEAPIGVSSRSRCTPKRDSPLQHRHRLRNEFLADAVAQQACHSHADNCWISSAAGGRRCRARPPSQKPRRARA
jgi:hypothetical protein